MSEKDDERALIAQIYNQLSDEAKELIVEVLRIENANLHQQNPTGLAEEILRRVEGIIK